MKRCSWLFVAAIVAAALTGCRGGGSTGIPAAPGVSNAAPSAVSVMRELEDPRVAERVQRNGRIGTSNTITADMPVSRPDTTPCKVTLFAHVPFKNFNDKTFNYTPPASCPGPWAKVVFNFDVRVTKGVQYDRTGVIWVDGAVVYFGSTAEPSTSFSPHWHVERDVTDLSALFKKPSQGQIELWNCYCPPTYNAWQKGTAFVQFYPADAKYPAPRVPDEVVGVPYSPPLGALATLPQSPMEMQKKLPHDITRAYLDLFLQSQSKEEQYFMCVPDDVWRKSLHALGFCRNTAFREGVVSVDGQPAGLAPIYPWIFTGGMDPNLWFPIPGVQTLNFTPFRLDLTPFAGVLSNGATQTIDVSVFRAFSYFSGAGDLLLYRDGHHRPVTGGVTKDTLTTPPDLTFIDHLAYGSGNGLFGGPTATGTIQVRSRAGYTIAGYTQIGSAKTTTTVNVDGLFVNNQQYDYQSNHYIQLVKQSTHYVTSTTTQEPTGNSQVVSATYDYPLTVSYPILPLTNGYRLPIKVYQGYRVQTTAGTHGRFTTELDNTVKSIDTMIFNSSLQWIGVRNGASEQLYTYASSRPKICYGKAIKSKNNAVTAIAEPGCNAPPLHRGPPKT